MAAIQLYLVLLESIKEDILILQMAEYYGH